MLVISIGQAFVFQKCRNKNISFVIKQLLFIAFVFLIIFLAKDILLGAFDFIAKSFGVQSRTIERLISGNISDDNGRATIQANIISNWENMPFFGYGLLGDRQFANGSYSHNVIVELITTFGYFSGIMIAAILLLSLIVRMNNTKDCRGLFILISSCVIVKMLFSGSFATETMFFVFVGCCLNYNSSIKSSKKAFYHSLPQRVNEMKVS